MQTQQLKTVITIFLILSLPFLDFFSSTRLPTIYILLTIAIILIILAFLRLSTASKRRIKRVTENSNLLIELDILNKEFSLGYHEEPLTFLYSMPCSNKRQFDRFDLHPYLQEQIFLEQEKIIDALDRKKLYSMRYPVYCDRFMELEKKSSLFLTNRADHKLEMEIFVSRKLKHPDENIICASAAKSYSSPKGQNNYYLSTELYNEDIRDAIKAENARRRYQQTVQSAVQAAHQRERSLMTESLRYDILRRDNFRCQICGASQADGVTLHVDHIMPVSKGGRTVPENLRTLCSRCNLGKRDKYVPNDVN